MTTAKNFQHGGSQAVRLPRAFRFHGTEVRIEKQGEDVLLKPAAVAECAVVGKPDADRGMVIKAFVVLKPKTVGDTVMVKTLQDFVKASIAPYKYPREIDFVSSLPRTETGKLQRFRLKTPA